jgi:hypothetical protein
MSTERFSISPKPGPERGYVREPQDLPPCNAELTVYVDDETIRRRVRLLDGMSSESRLVRFGDPV